MLPIKKKLTTKRLTSSDTISNTSVKYLCAVSYNLNANPKYIKPRTLHIFKILNAKMPDIISLYEVTPEIYKILESIFGSKYILFQAFIENREAYGACLLFKKETIKILERPYYYDYDSIKSTDDVIHKIIGCHIQWNTCNFHAIATQLIGGKDNTMSRVSQIELLTSLINETDITNYLLLGDFGIIDGTEAAHQKLMKIKSIQDSWIMAGCPFKVKYTYNAMLNKSITDGLQCRYDRILYSADLFKVIMFGLIGLSHLSSELDFPASTHYGIIVIFSI